MLPKIYLWEKENNKYQLCEVHSVKHHGEIIQNNKKTFYILAIFPQNVRTGL